MPPPSAAALPPVLGIGADIDTQEKYLAYAGLENAHLGSARWRDSGKASRLSLWNSPRCNLPLSL